MHEKNVAKYVIGSLVILLFIAGCGGLAATPTAVLPTDTPEPPTPTTQPPYITDGFPYGKYTSKDDPTCASRVEFRDNGTTRWIGPGWELQTKNAVLGNIWVTMTFNDPSGIQVPNSYYWSFDGYDLTFEPIGSVLRVHHRQCLSIPYTYAGELDPSTPIDTPTFPTGRFVSEDGTRAFEFDAEGNWRFFENDMEHPARYGQYVTNKNYYTEATQNDEGFVENLGREAQVPVTYTWTFEDGRLTFKVWGVDVIETRRLTYDQQTYIQVEE